MASRIKYGNLDKYLYDDAIDIVNKATVICFNLFNEDNPIIKNDIQLTSTLCLLIAIIYSDTDISKMLQAEGFTKDKIEYVLNKKYDKEKMFKYFESEIDSKYESDIEMTNNKIFDKMFQEQLLYTHKRSTNFKIDINDIIFHLDYEALNEIFEIDDCYGWFYKTETYDILLQDQKDKEKEYEKKRKLKEDIKTLNKYGTFLTDKNFEFNPAIGRSKELRKIEGSIITPNKSAIITGEAGVGKTAIAEGLAYLIQKGEVPNLLKDYKIYNLTTTSLVSGCNLVGQFEEKVEEIFGILKKFDNIILNIDEIHTAVGLGTGSKGNLDFVNILKPYLDRGDIKLLATTTEEEYKRLILPDPAFARRFEKIKINELEKDAIIQILNSRIPYYEKIMKVNFPIDNRLEILEEIVNITDKKHRVYNDNVNNPDLSIYLLSKIFVNAALDNHEEVTIEDMYMSINDCDRLYDTAKNETCRKLKNIVKQKEEKKGNNKIIKLEF